VAVAVTRRSQTQAERRARRGAPSPQTDRTRGWDLRRAPPEGLPQRAASYSEFLLRCAATTPSLDWIDESVRRRVPSHMTAAAVHLVMLAQDDSAIRNAVLGASLVVPDGQPLVWALRLYGHREIRSRIYGPDLMLACCERAAARGTRMYLYGGRSEAALVALTLALRTRFPGLQIVGAYSPPHVGSSSSAPFREPTPEEDLRTVEEIDGSGAEIVWVGHGQPRQELWMERMRPRLQAPMLIGVGAAFDFHAGLVAQAPPWLGRHGLEWAYRLAARAAAAVATLPALQPALRSRRRARVRRAAASGPTAAPIACAPTMAPRALITGVTGQDGSYLAELLLERGYEVHGMVRRSSVERFDRIEHLRGKITLHQGDLLDQRSLVDAPAGEPTRGDLQPRRDVVRRRLLGAADAHGRVQRRRRDTDSRSGS